VFDPFHVPQLGTPKPSNYKNPLNTAVLVTDFVGVTGVFANDKVLNVTYKQKMDAITNGYGNVLGWPDTPKYQRDHTILINTVELDDYQRIHEWALKTAEYYITKKARAVRNTRTLDIVAGVIDPIATLVVKEYFGIPFVGEFDEENKRLVSHKTMSDWLDIIFQWIFLDQKPEDSVILAKEAVKAAAELEAYILKIIKLRKQYPSQFNNNNNLLARLLEMQQRSRDPEGEGLSDQIITYNLMGCIVGCKSNISKAASFVIEYLLGPDAEKQKVLVQIQGVTAQKALEQYALEAMRLSNPTPALFRVALQNSVIKSKGGKETPVKGGQLVILGLAQASYDPDTFSAPTEFKLDRPDGNYLTFGYDFHHCFGRRQALATITAIMRAILSKRDVRTEQPGAKLSYLTRDGLVSPYPQSLDVSFSV